MTTPLNLARLHELEQDELLLARAHIARLVENFKACRWATKEELVALSVQVDESLSALATALRVQEGAE
jgi:hypothetical protein